MRVPDYRSVLTLLFGLLLYLPGVSSQSVGIPNASFESPSTSFVSTLVDTWQKTPKPDGYVEGGGFLWDQLIGVFANTPPSASDHIINCDGDQAIYIFAVPGVGLFQDYDSVDWNDPEPTHAFDATFEIGRRYELSFGVIGRGGGMLEGVPLEASFYYRDGLTNQVIVSSTTVTNSAELFPDRNHFVDFQIMTPVVQATDAWAGHHIGIRFLSTVSDAMQGGYWDLDNVRLNAIGELTFSVEARLDEGSLRLSWPSETGYTYQIAISTNLDGWADLGDPQDGTGEPLTAAISLADLDHAFFNVVATPVP